MATRITDVRSSSARVPLSDAARAWAEGVDFRGTALRRLQIARTKAPTTGPEALQRAFRLHSTWAANDLGSVRLYRAPIDARAVFALHTTTDGDAGFLELFSERGALLATGVTGVRDDGRGRFRPTITWDDVPGAVRATIAPRDVSPAVPEFQDAIGRARTPGSPSGRTVAGPELVGAAKGLVGDELTPASVDGFENAALHAVLADASVKLTAGARDYGARLGSLYLDQDPKKLRKVEVPATSALTGRDGGWSATARAATAEVQGRRAGPKLGAFLELAKSAWALLPSQLVPATRTEVTTALRASGAKLAEARAVVEALGGADAVWFSGKVISLAEGRLPRREGIAVFASSADGKKIGGIFVPEVGNSAEIQPREIIRELVGVDREVAVVARAASQDGDRLALEWRPLWGGVVKANLDVPRDGGAPQVSGVEVPAVLEPNLAQILRGHLTAALGAVDVAAWVGRDDARGPGFFVVHTPAGQRGPMSVAEVRIALGGAAAVTPVAGGIADEALARDLALVLARSHAAKLVADPQIEDAARLEVALRTGWADAASLERVDPQGSAVGFDPRREHVQLAMPSVWGDNAVFVTFAKDGTVRVEDVN